MWLSSRAADDIEPEEIDLGYERNELAADVDTGIELEEDPDALDSDEEYQADDPDGLFEEREEESDSRPACSNDSLCELTSA